MKQSRAIVTIEAVANCASVGISAWCGGHADRCVSWFGIRGCHAGSSHLGDWMWRLLGILAGGYLCGGFVLSWPWQDVERGIKYCDV